MENVPQIDLRGEGLPAHAERRREQALAVRDACLGWLPLGGLLAWLADPFVRWWLRRSRTPFLGEVAAIAATLGRPGIWLDVPKEVAQARVAGRKADASDATAAVIERQFGYDLGRITWQRRHRA